jgi:glycosyltransferase involved in cell wall biosynthesis
MPTVSICIPTYDEPKYFRRALSSVLEQDFTDFEVIVTDDSPSDAIDGVLRETSDDRIVYTRNARRLGVPANWNRAADLATGEFVKFLHHDDCFSSSTSLGRFVGLLVNDPDADFALSASNVCSPEQRLQRVYSPADHVARLQADPRALLLGNWIGAPSATIYRRTLNARFDQRLIWVVDIDFYLSILASTSHFAYTDEPLVSITDGAAHQVTSSVANDPRLELFEWFYLYGKWAPRFPLRGERGRFLDALLARNDSIAWNDYRSLGLRGRSARLFIAAMTLRKLGRLSSRSRASAVMRRQSNR